MCLLNNSEWSRFRTRRSAGSSALEPAGCSHLHLSHFEIIPSFSPSYWGGQFLLPQRTNYQKWEFFQLQNRMRQGFFSAWGIQTRPFAAHYATFVSKKFHLFHFHTGRPIPITPEGQYWEKGNFSTPKLDETEGFQCLGHSNWTICSPLSHFCSNIFSLFQPSYWGTISYYPRRPIIRNGNSSNFKTE